MQWHPERMFTRDQTMLLLFKAFVEACGTGRGASDYHAYFVERDLHVVGVQLSISEKFIAWFKEFKIERFLILGFVL